MLLGVMTLLAPMAMAQVRPELPASIVEAASIGAGERSQIDAFVALLAPIATENQPEATARARRELITPLLGRQPSVAFRQAYSQAASDLLAGLLGDDDAGARIAGLRLAGNLATGETAGLVQRALEDDDAGIRLFAAVQARRIFEITATAGPALTEPQALRLIEAAAASVEAESDRAHIQAVIRALGAAAQIRARELTATRSAALAALARVGAARAEAAGPQNLLGASDTLLLATSIATRSVSEAGVAVSDDAARASAELGGEILAVILARQTQNLIGTDAEADVRLLAAGESLIYFARRRQVENARGSLSGVPQTNLAELLRTKDRGFRNELVRLIGRGSALLRQFGLPDDRFID
jgi:hypothetical protein